MSTRAISLHQFILRQERLHPEATGEFTNLLTDIALAAKIINREVTRAGLVDILGLTGRRILQALIEGRTDPGELAELRHPTIKATREELVDALRNTVTPHHRFMLRLHLGQIDALKHSLAELDQQIEGALGPFRDKARLLDTIPGVDLLTAQVLLAEIGDDMERFPSASHLVSWACLCPTCDESAGKRRSTRIRKGGAWLKATLVQSAWGAVRTKDAYLRALYYRIRARRGPKKAIVAVAHALGKEVVAEGIEGELQRLHLARIGCDLAQGYLFSRPLEATGLAHWLALHGAETEPRVRAAAPGKS